jgi:hypothetical protein
MIYAKDWLQLMKRFVAINISVGNFMCLIGGLREVENIKI